MCHSPMPAETNGRSFDANQNEMMEKSPQEWNEQLEKEFFSGKCVSLLVPMLSPWVTVVTGFREFSAEEKAVKMWLIAL